MPKIDDAVVIFKTVSGETVVGSATSTVIEGTEFMVVRDPVEIRISDDGIMLVRWNMFSKNNTVVVLPSSIMFIDVPNDACLEQYSKFIKAVIEEPKAETRVLH